MNQIIQNI